MNGSLTLLDDNLLYIAFSIIGISSKNDQKMKFSGRGEGHCPIRSLSLYFYSTCTNTSTFFASTSCTAWQGASHIGVEGLRSIHLGLLAQHWVWNAVAQNNLAGSVSTCTLRPPRILCGLHGRVENTFSSSQNVCSAPNVTPLCKQCCWIAEDIEIVINAQ